MALPAFLSGRKLSPSSHLDCSHFSSSLNATDAFKLLPVFGGSEGESLSKFVWGFFHRNCLVLHKFLPLTQSPLVSAAKSCGDLSSWQCYPGLGAWCGSGTLFSWVIPPEFLSTTCGCGTSPFQVSSPPTSLDGCGFFNSVVVRLPFNSISAGSEWWLFYNLFIILMWMCKEVSHGCLLTFFLILSYYFSCLKSFPIFMNCVMAS